MFCTQPTISSSLIVHSINIFLTIKLGTFLIFYQTLLLHLSVYDRIQNKVPKNKFGRHATARGLQTNKIATVLCLACCVNFNIVKGQLCPQSLCGWIGDCPGNERD